MKHFFTSLFFALCYCCFAQNTQLVGKVTSISNPVEYATVFVKGTVFATTTDSLGNYFFKNLPASTYTLEVTCVGFIKTQVQFVLLQNEEKQLDIDLKSDKHSLDEVVITGVTKATLVRENPIAIMSISSKAIEQSNESNIIDALVKNAPGLNAVKTGPNISKPFIRGLGYNRVLTLYDGVRQEGQQWGDEHGIEVDAYNTDKAEVIKGPASLMYGSDALAGVISLLPFIPNQKDSKLHGKFTSEYQTNNGLIGNGLRLTYCNMHWLYSVSGSYKKARNYENKVDGRVYNTGFDEKNVAALIGYENGKGFSHLNFTLYDNLQGIPDGSRDSLSRRFTKQINEGLMDTLQHRPVVTNSELNSYQLPPLHQHIKHYRIYTHHNYKIKNTDLDILVAFQQNVRKEYNHPTAPSKPGLYVRLNTVNYGVRYNLVKFLNIETAIGMNGMQQNNKSKNATDFPIPNYNLLDAGIYFHLKWKFKKWTLSGGVRYDKRFIEWNDFYVTNNSITGFSEEIHIPDSNSYLQYSKYKKTVSGISASFGLTHKFSDHISIKANIARGYRAPSITELGSNGLDPGAHIIYYGNRNFNPEFSLQEDVGINGSYKNVSTSLSIFNTSIQNYIYLSQLVDAANNPLTDAQGNKTFQYMQSKAHLYGLEAFISIHPDKLKGLVFDNSFTCVYGYNKKSSFKDKKTAGEYLPFIPPLKWLSVLSQKIKLSGKVLRFLTPKLEVEWSASQNKYLALYQTETYTPSYTLLNIGISAEMHWFKERAFQLQLQVNNVLDEAYQSNLNRLKYFEYYSASPNGRAGIYNMGRNVCFKMIVPL